jgi:hypothetical protein
MARHHETILRDLKVRKNQKTQVIFQLSSDLEIHTENRRNPCVRAGNNAKFAANNHIRSVRPGVLIFYRANSNWRCVSG